MSTVRPRYRHSACIWTVGDGSSRFTGVSRPSLTGVDVARKVKLVAAGRTGVAGVEFHYPNEANERNAKTIRRILDDHGLVTAMLSPNQHGFTVHRALSSAHDRDRNAAIERGKRAIDLAYVLGTKVLVLWQGAEKYDDYTSINLPDAIRRYADAINELSRYDTAHGDALVFGAEAKPNEPGRYMLFQTDSDYLALRALLADPRKFKLNPETGHAELAGLDPVQALALILAQDALAHYHVNKQFGTKFDTDDQVDVDKTRLYLFKLLLDAEFDGFVGHDIQPRHNYTARDAVGVIRESVANARILERLVGAVNWRHLDALERAGEYLEAKMYLDGMIRRAR